MSIQGKDITKVVIACDAGMGSSVMVASQMAKRLKPYKVAVQHSPVNEIPADAQVVLCQQGLVPRAQKNSSGALVIGFQNFMGDPVFDRVEAAIRDGGELG
ncbi:MULTISPECIES: PTS lactose transporter subunit IIB [Saccharothrix]|uniref:PTS lactose transporter subunit IIB n=2 Tax=Saccharothrix TaxID=2071 RepID=A0ABU0X588_9PSEU|nr:MULTISPECIES: PTS lactose transporter subunit IIB [Saccharothrix]MDQ2586409.1 PTS lactose transporter subunit IIB [Saccharothrix yanglingensis]MDR6593168.1 PTS system mannitol-specific IIB component [Saccharothrix longispora]